MILGELNSSKRESSHVLDDDSIISSSRMETAQNLKLDLEKAISFLPKQARAVFVLHDIEGWKLEEIAGTMGLAVGTCKAQLSRARRILREVLGT